ncbi:MAG TPA: MarR family transcriptional regulator [Candidatus Limnocylindria bacterium]|nr:MarR family transcriptional regulator [Candidatus Limnocylindria bacterium]
MPTQSIPRTKRRLSEAEIRAWEAFLRAYAATSHALEREAESRGGLAIGDHFVLVQIARGPETGMRPTELAERALLTKSGVTRAVDRLERADLVARIDCPTDGRGSHVILTVKGRRLLRRAAPGHMRAIAKHFADPLSPHELAVLTTALERVATTA